MPINKSANIGKGTIIHKPELCCIHNCKIGSNCEIGPYVSIREGVFIGDNCIIKPFVSIPERITIGNNVFIDSNVCFSSYRYKGEHLTKENLLTIIEDNVGIGAGSIIWPGTKIGRRAIIGPGSNVLHHVKEGQAVMGNPARDIKRVAKEIEVKQLEEALVKLAMHL